MQHLASGIQSISREAYPLWGTLSWVPSFSPSKCYTILSGNLLPGRNAPSCAYDAHKSQFAHRLVLHAAGTSVDLQDAANHIDQRTFGVGSLGGTPVFKGTRVSVRTLFE